MAARSVAQKLRQHHAIEHATVTLLSRQLPGIQVVARSDLAGFLIYGDIDTAVVRGVAEDALARLQAGQVELALHPNCGTNLVTAGVLSGLAAVAAGSGRSRPWWDRLPSAVLAATLALVVAAPAGRWMQRSVTTTADVAGLSVIAVSKLNGGPVTCHRVAIGDARRP